MPASTANKFLSKTLVQGGQTLTPEQAYATTSYQWLLAIPVRESLSVRHKVATSKIVPDDKTTNAFGFHHSVTRFDAEDQQVHE